MNESHRDHLAHRLYGFAKGFGGATLNIDGTECVPTGGGYAVGGKCPSGIFSAYDAEFVTKERISRWLTAIPDDTEYVGCWVDGDTLYVDATDILSDALEAIKLGHQRGEQAIYSFADEESWSLDDSQYIGYR